MANAIKMEITASMLYHLAPSLWTRPNVIHIHCFQASFGMALQFLNCWDKHLYVLSIHKILGIFFKLCF